MTFYIFFTQTFYFLISFGKCTYRTHHYRIIILARVSHFLSPYIFSDIMFDFMKSFPYN